MEGLTRYLSTIEATPVREIGFAPSLRGNPHKSITRNLHDSSVSFLPTHPLRRRPFRGDGPHILCGCVLIWRRFRELETFVESTDRPFSSPPFLFLLPSCSSYCLSFFFCVNMCVRVCWCVCVFREEQESLSKLGGGLLSKRLPRAERLPQNLGSPRVARFGSFL